MRVSFRHRRIRRRRPVALPEWARLMALTSLVLAYVGWRQQEWPYAAGFLIAAVAGLVWWWRTPADADYSPEFPYVYIGDLPSELVADRQRGGLSRGARTLLAGALALIGIGSILLIEPTLLGLRDGAVAAALVGIWAREIPTRPPLWVIVVSVLAGVGGGIVLALIGTIVGFVFGTGRGDLATGFLAGTALMGTPTFVMLALYAAGSRYPVSLFPTQE